MASSSRMIERLQALRFVAASLVLVGHILMEMLQHNFDLGPVRSLVDLPWGAGVDVFFVISGFIISHSSMSRPASFRSVADFMTFRLIRIWPTYLMFTALMLVAVAVVPRFLAHNVLTIPFVIASFFFLPWPRPDDHRMFPVLGQGWTLNYEMFFYLSFAVTLRAPAKYRATILIVCGALLVALGQLTRLPQPLAFYADPIIGEFLMGVLLSEMMHRLPDRPKTGALIMVLALVLLFAVSPHQELPRILTFGIPAALLVLGVLLSGAQGERILGRPWLVLLGSASYALYLSHTFVVNMILFLWLKFHWASPELLFATIFLSAVLASIIVYKFIEQPSLAFLKSAIPGRRTK